MKVRLRLRAQQDLAAILDHGVAEHGEAAAEAYLKRIDAALALVGEHPQLGRSEGERARDLRSYPVGEHRLYYLLLPDWLSVVRVLHQRVDARLHLGEVKVRGWLAVAAGPDGLVMAADRGRAPAGVAGTTVRREVRGGGSELSIEIRSDAQTGCSM